MQSRAIRWLAVLVLAIAAPSACAADDVPTGRLPRTVVPERVALDLALDANAKTFEGRVAIAVAVTEPTDVVWMHGRDLRIARARFVPEQGEAVDLAATQVHASGVLKLAAPRPLPRGRGRIEIEYGADFSTTLEGAYRVTSGDASYVITQMEPLGARSAFPMFDEPSFKQPWDVSITVPEGQAAIANTHQVGSTDVDGGRRRLQYATTEPLPSYLVAFVVGPWDVVDAAPIPPTKLRTRPIALRGIAAKGKGPELAYALEHTAAIVVALEEWFDVAYPFDKLDLVAAPDFAFGAMENAGLIVYRDTLLLSIDKAPAAGQAAYWAVHTHELAHQWFGNLVTMPWWDDIWLNEAFATWLERKVAHRLRPEFNLDRATVSAAVRAMASDSLASTRRVREPVRAHTDVLSAFDGITYSKGGAVLAMFEAYLGETAFRDGIRRHVRRFAGGNATSSDLLASLAEGRADARALDAAFRSFVDRPGVPFVDADLRCDGTAGPRVELVQRRYVPLGSTLDAEQRWHVPLCLRHGDGKGSTRQCTLLDRRRETLVLDAKRCPDWLLPNADGGGYFRFAVADDDRAGLVGAFATLSAKEQMVYADSLVAAFEAGSSSADALLDALPGLAASPVGDVVIAPFEKIRWLAEQVAVAPHVRSALVARVDAAYRPRVAALGTRVRTDDSPEDRQLRAELLALFAEVLGDAPLRAELARRGRAVIDAGGAGALDADAVEPDLRALALRLAGATGGAAEFALVEKHARATGDTLLRRQLLTALGEFRDPALATRARTLALDAHWQPSEVVFPLRNQLTVPVLRPDARKWLRANHATVMQRVPRVMRDKLAGYDATGLCRAADADALDAFYRARVEDVDGGPRSLAMAVENVRLCAALRARHDGVSLAADGAP